MDDDKELLVITWVVRDVRNMFEEIKGRQPTDEELKECVRRIDFKSLEACSIERGWQFIENAIEDEE